MQIASQSPCKSIFTITRNIHIHSYNVTTLVSRTSHHTCIVLRKLKLLLRTGPVLVQETHASSEQMLYLLTALPSIVIRCSSAVPSSAAHHGATSGGLVFAIPAALG